MTNGAFEEWAKNQDVHTYQRTGESIAKQGWLACEERYRPLVEAIKKYHACLEASCKICNALVQLENKDG